MDNVVLFVVSVLAGGIGAISGFGIGSVLTPLAAWGWGTKLAVAWVSIPHFFSTAYRCWLLRAHIDRRVFLTFGLSSAGGGLAGAYIHTIAASRTLSFVFGTLLILASLGQLTGFWNRMRFGPRVGWFAGLVSGFLGGLVGNQGGIRTAAMFGFRVRKEAFVATGTAAALVVDLVRMPIYVWSQKAAFEASMSWVLVAIAGTMLGTWMGVRWLRQIPESIYTYLVATLLFLLGLVMLHKGMYS